MKNCEYCKKKIMPNEIWWCGPHLVHKQCRLYIYYGPYKVCVICS